MDFLSLYVTASILHRAVKLRHLCASSAIGGVYGVLSIFIDGILLFNVTINLAVSYLMCLIVFPKRTLPCYALFYGAGFLIGGAMTAFFTFMNGFNHASTESDALTGKIPLGWMAVSAALIGVAAIAGGRMARGKRSLRPCRLSVISLSGSFVFDAMTDSGNLLCDPMSGKPVILMRKTELLSILPSELFAVFENSDANALTGVSPSLVSSVRLIPSVSVGGDKLLFAFLPRKIAVDGVEVSAVIAMGDDRLYGSFPALVPEILIP